MTTASLDVGVIRFFAIIISSVFFGYFCSIKTCGLITCTQRRQWKLEKIKLIKSSKSNKVQNIQLRLVAGGYVNTWERTILSPISCLDVEVDMERMWLPT